VEVCVTLKDNHKDFWIWIFGFRLLIDQKDLSGLQKSKIKIIYRMSQLTDLPAKQLAPGLTGYYAHGQQLTLGMVHIKEGSKLPEHHHVHEQITYIIEGQLDMTIDGKACSLRTGMYHVIPSNTPHSAIAITDCKLIDVFNPVREDYISTKTT
jgi:quercetin dioxygenase-like cupin family protein